MNIDMYQSLKERLKHTGGFSILRGISLGDWLRILSENRFDIDRQYWLRAAGITLHSVVNSVLDLYETCIFGPRVRKVKIHPPVFVVGIWRSGTTHLHNLLALDRRLAFPNVFEAWFPHCFLSTQWLAKLLFRRVVARRPQDNMRYTLDSPDEDEHALATICGRSPRLSLVFPRRMDFYERYLTFRNVPQADLRRWQQALVGFYRKLTFKYDRPLVVKSPLHTARIKLLLDLFPDARFVHVHRNPYEIYQSGMHTILRVQPVWALQRPDTPGAIEHWVLNNYKEAYDAFFDERPLVPAGRFHELGFAALQADPLGELRKTYEALGLPDFAETEPAVRGYIDSIAGYKKNKYADLPDEVRQKVAGFWSRSFTEWGYPV